MESKKLTRQIAIDACQAITKLGFDGMRAFFFVSSDHGDPLCDNMDESETKGEFIDRLMSACWSGQGYFRMWLQEGHVKYPTVRIHSVANFTLDDGLFYVDVHGSESHYFLWIVDGTDIWYVGTYGGVASITMKKFVKSDYLTRFVSAMEGSKKDYAYVFQVDPCQPYFVMEYMQIERSLLYL